MKIDLNDNEFKFLCGLLLDAIEDAEEELETAYRNLYDKMYGCLDESTECCKTLKDAENKAKIRINVNGVSIDIFECPV